MWTLVQNTDPHLGSRHQLTAPSASQCFPVHPVPPSAPQAKPPEPTPFPIPLGTSTRSRLHASQTLSPLPGITRLFPPSHLGWVPRAGTAARQLHPPPASPSPQGTAATAPVSPGISGLSPAAASTGAEPRSPGVPLGTCRVSISSQDVLQGAHEWGKCRGTTSIPGVAPSPRVSLQSR